MASTTTNYGLHKIDLTDAPPDITVLNQNFDIIDEKLNEHDNLTASDVGARPDTWMPTASQVGALSDEGGTLSGNLKLLRGNSPTIEMEVLSDNGYTSMYQHGGTFTTSSGMSSDSDESFMVLTKPSEDDDSSIFRIGRTINNSSKYYKLYGEHNKPTASDIGALPLDGSVPMSADLKISGCIYNTEDTSDIVLGGGSNYANGAHIRLYGKNASSNVGRFDIKATDGTKTHFLAGYPNGKLEWQFKELYGEYNRPTGSYTGNGSATQRSIAITNCTGRMLLVFAYYEESGIDAASLVFFNGAFGSNGSGTFTNFSKNQARFSFNGSDAGSLVIASNSDLLNKNGVKYHYKVI